MKGWSGGAAFTLALALLFGQSDFGACKNVTDDQQLDSFASLGGDSGQADTIAALDGTPLPADSLCTEGAETCMTVATGMQASLPEPVFASKLAARRSKLQSNEPASGLAANQTKGPSRKLKKRYVFIGLGAVSIALAAALGGGYLVWQRHDVPKPYTKIRVDGLRGQTHVPVPMESLHTHLKLKGDGPEIPALQRSLMEKSFDLHLKPTQVHDLVEKYGGFNALRICMLRKMFGLNMSETLELFDTMYKSPGYTGPLDLDSPVRVFPVMTEIRRAYNSWPYSYERISRILIEFFSRGQLPQKSADMSKVFFPMCKLVRDNNAKIPSWFETFPDSLEGALKKSR
eukprot:GHVT01068453.1.p1 GENE.GHVT01068453.1~~GHVT01068453.1.p1  ORF type:complete len:344 (+),score=30.69 GHVT01068453.1:346-1377(+)